MIRRAARIAVVTVASLLLGAPAALACPVCFGAEESTLVDGTRLGVWVMLAFTVAVQGGFVWFFLYLRKRAKRMAMTQIDTEWSDMQKATR